MSIALAVLERNTRQRSPGRDAGNDPVYNDYDIHRRLEAGVLDFSSIPTTQQAITHLDMDLTLACNLRCTYCFKVKDNEHQDVQIALDAVTWLIYASGDAEEISLVMIGGEPLVKFDTMKKLVPFAVRRAAQHGKKLRLSITTNGTIVNDEILEFFKQWKIGFHTSIDGHPAVHDRHRVYANGKGSSHILAKNLPRILSAQPNTCARSTIMPDTAGELYESMQYFLHLGYVKMAFVPAAPAEWDDESIELLRHQFGKVADTVIELFREGRQVTVKFIDEMCRAKAERTRARSAPCGVGRGMMLADVNGDLWPCHRWSKQSRDWVMGSLYAPGHHSEARAVFFDIPEQKSDYHDCPTCIARPVCAGGCPAENLEETGDPWKRHINSCRLEEVFATAGIRVYETLSNEGNPTFLKTYFETTNNSESEQRRTAS